MQLLKGFSVSPPLSQPPPPLPVLVSSSFSSPSSQSGHFRPEKFNGRSRHQRSMGVNIGGAGFYLCPKERGSTCAAGSLEKKWREIDSILQLARRQEVAELISGVKPSSVSVKSKEGWMTQYRNKYHVALLAEAFLR